MLQVVSPQRAVTAPWNGRTQSENTGEHYEHRAPGRGYPQWGLWGLQEDLRSGPCFLRAPGPGSSQGRDVFPSVLLGECPVHTQQAYPTTILNRQVQDAGITAYTHPSPRIWRAGSALHPPDDKRLNVVITTQEPLPRCCCSEFSHSWWL